MKQRMICILAAWALVAPVGNATAASKSPKLAKCSGKQRRPANPYGSILPSVDPVSGTSVPAAQGPGQEQESRGVELFPEKAPAAPMPARPGSKSERVVPPISSVLPPTPQKSC
jgi:hypothetical protein